MNKKKEKNVQSNRKKEKGVLGPKFPAFQIFSFKYKKREAIKPLFFFIQLQE